MNKSGRIKKTVLFWVLVLCFALICFICIEQIVKSNKKTAELQARKDRLEQLIEEQEQRRLDLEDEEVYVKTRKYIEEKAKSIGYVYPDEIIFREDD